jgi:hypothetical protein
MDPAQHTVLELLVEIKQDISMARKNLKNKISVGQ